MATLLHELSHGLAALFTSGSLGRMTINPFSWSYSHSFSPNQLVHLTAGAGGAILIGIVIFFILYRWCSPWLLPLLLIGPIALIDNGAYYVVDILMRSGGDACRLIDEGIPSAVSVSAGVLFVVSGFALAILLVRKIGLLSCHFKGRLVVLCIGILPSTLAMLIWNWIYNQPEAGLWAIYSAASVILMLIFAAVPTRLLHKDAHIGLAPGWKPVIAINLLYAGLLTFFLAGPFFSDSSNPFNIDIEHFSERPEYFPDVMIAPSYATDISYSCSSKSKLPYLFSYRFPESILPEQIRTDVTGIYKKHGFILLTHSIFDPNEVWDDGWSQENDETYGVPDTTKSYKQIWLKVGPQPLNSFVRVNYTWKKNKFSNAFVMNVISPFKHEPFYDYAIAHPEQFDPNEIEQLRKLSLIEKQSQKDPNQLEEK